MASLNKKHTLVLGASTNPLRYANICIRELVHHQVPVSAIGLRSGSVAGVEIQTGQPVLSEVHTITLYLGAPRQAQYFDYIIDLRPERIIFNPGTWNPDLEKLARQHGIVTVSDCTLMMLSGEYY
ncbi:MAG: CoA-binding protein [Lentimicrobium sp.]|jgi:predicted CoA-binding protein|nr:CoA-binding protein [Lentimicrobium sp.]